MRSSICNCHRIRYSLTIQIVSTGNHYGPGFVATKASLKSYQTQQYRRRSRSSLWNGIVLQLTALSISFVPSQPQKAGFATRSATKLACITPTDITERGPLNVVSNTFVQSRPQNAWLRQEAQRSSLEKHRQKPKRRRQYVLLVLASTTGENPVPTPGNRKIWSCLLILLPIDCKLTSQPTLPFH